jgi:hypothetical protein
MKSRSTVRALVALPLILFAFSCASAPKKPAPEPTAPAAGPTASVAAQEVPAPDDQKAAAEKARAEAAVYGSESSFPADWKSASDAFAAGETAYGKDNAASRTAFEKAAKEFTDLAAKAKPLFLEKLAQERGRAEKARKQAFDLDAQTSLPADWKTAETSFLGAREAVAAAEGGKIESYPEGLKSYTAAADAFEALAQKALPIFADARRDEVVKARADAVAAGAVEVAPDRLSVADQVVSEAIAKYDAKDYYGAYDSLVAARDRYYALATGVRAYKVKEDIDARGLAAYDSGNYKLASGKLESALSSYDAGNIGVSRDAAEEAHLRFMLALAKGQELYAGERGKAALEKKATATGLKAQVAVKADYEAASATLSEADSAYKAQRWDDAAELYKTAESSFSDVADAAARKRAAAEKAIEEAQARMEASARTAQEADALIEGGTR